DVSVSIQLPDGRASGVRFALRRAGMKTATLLLVEGDLGRRATLSVALRGGYVVTTGATLEGALAEAAVAAVDVAVLDAAVRGRAEGARRHPSARRPRARHGGRRAVAAPGQALSADDRPHPSRIRDVRARRRRRAAAARHRARRRNARGAPGFRRCRRDGGGA